MKDRKLKKQTVQRKPEDSCQQSLPIRLDQQAGWDG